MDFVKQFVESNEMISSLLALLGAFTTFMTVLATITPTKKDDQIVSVLDKVGAFADRFGIKLK